MTDIQYTGKVSFWLNQIEAAQKARKDYYERGKAVLDRYIDEKRAAQSPNSNTSHRMNVLWSNVQTIQPALYAKTPNPKVQRRYRDKDPVGKWCAIVVERSLGFCLDAYDVDYHIRQAILDFLLPGCGTAWVSYEPQTEGEGDAEKIVWEKCNTEHLNWKDYLSSVSRTSDEDWWRARRVYLTREKIEKRFGKPIAEKLSFEEGREDSSSGADSDRLKKVPVWEIWCKSDGKRYFVSKSCPEFLEEPQPPPHKFDGFFPCPRPLLATTTPESTIPQADFYLYQDQANEIDRLTQRIATLTEALKVVGVYSAPLEGEDNVMSTLLNGTDNKMVPVKNWAMFAQQGGFDGAVDFFPIKDVVDTLQQCYVAREQAKAAMYEITGISDIVRGASDAQETATAQQIKSQWGSLRIRDRQAEVQRFVRDIMRLESEIIAERYQLDTLKAMTNCPLLMQQEKQQLQMRQQISGLVQQAQQIPPEQQQAMLAANPQLGQMVQMVQQNPQMAAPLSLDEMQQVKEPTWEEVYQLLKDEKLRSYRIDIETDSTIEADEVKEKMARNEFIQGMTAFVQAWGPIIMAQPKLAPLAGALMTFGARSFKQADTLETEIEAMVDMMSQQAMLPQPEQPQDPKIAADAQKAEFEAKKHQDTMALEQQKMEREDAFRREQADKEMQAKAQSEQLAAQKEIATKELQAREKVGIAQTKQPRSEEIATALGPVAQALQQVMGQMAEQQSQALQQIAEAAQATQQQIAQSVSDGLAKIEQATQQLAAIASAPKDIELRRGADGRVSGGTAKPRMN